MAHPLFKLDMHDTVPHCIVLFQWNYHMFFWERIHGFNLWLPNWEGFVMEAVEDALLVERMCVDEKDEAP